MSQVESRGVLWCLDLVTGDTCTSTFQPVLSTVGNAELDVKSRSCTHVHQIHLALFTVDNVTRGVQRCSQMPRPGHWWHMHTHFPPGAIYNWQCRIRCQESFAYKCTSSPPSAIYCGQCRNVCPRAVLTPAQTWSLGHAHPPPPHPPPLPSGVIYSWQSSTRSTHIKVQASYGTRTCLHNTTQSGMSSNLCPHTTTPLPPSPPPRFSQAYFHVRPSSPNTWSSLSPDHTSPSDLLSLIVQENAGQLDNHFRLPSHLTTRHRTVLRVNSLRSQS